MANPMVVGEGLSTDEVKTLLNSNAVMDFSKMNDFIETDQGIIEENMPKVPEFQGSDKEWMMELLHRDPTILSYCETLQVTGGKIQTPTEAIGEKRLFASMMVGKPNFWQWRDRSFTASEKIYIASVMMNCPVVFIKKDPYMLLREMTLKVTKAYIEAPEENRPKPKPLPYQSFYFTTETGEEYTAYTKNADHQEKVHIDGTLLMSVSPPGSGMTFTQALYFNWGERWVVIDQVVQTKTDSLALFLNEKIFRINKFKIPRAMRRQIEREGKTKPCEEEVSIIDLREFERGPKGKGDGESDMEYSHRWFVRGHPRNQYFPSDGHHEIVWIDPYVKGPDDKPFKKKVLNVIR